MIEKIFSKYKTNLTPDQTMKDQIWNKIASADSFNSAEADNQAIPPVKHFARNLFRNGLIFGGVATGLVAFVILMIVAIPVIQSLIPASGILIQNSNYQVGEKITNSDLSGLEKVKSCADLTDKLKTSQSSSGSWGEGMMLNKSTAVAPVASVSDSSRQTPTFTATNVQVAGIDESDIVKTDGKTVFSIDKTSNVINVVTAYPANRAAKITDLKLTNAQPQELFLSNGKLIIISTAYFPMLAAAEKGVTSSIAPLYPYYNPATVRISIYDVSNVSQIELMKEYDVEGSFVTARLVNDMVYLVSNKYYYNYSTANNGEDQVIPMYSENTGINKATQPTAKCADTSIIGGFSTPMISTISIFDLIDVYHVSPAFFNFVGSTSTVYMSYSNIYLVSDIWQNPMPMMNYSNQGQSTRITKVAYYQDKLKFVATTEFAGQLLNQFSLDEDKNGVLRVAGTKGDIFQGTSQSYLYTFDARLGKMGEITNLARTEKIYSVRFYGDIGIVVTFKKVDPLFVFDLSNPATPKLKGELKIPGFSDYLHFINPTTVIGFGKEAIDASSEDTSSRQLDFAWYQGLKLAVFDITDLANPKEISKLVMGERGSDSEALTNHKAFVYDEKHGLIILPTLLTKVDRSKCAGYQDPNSCYGTAVSQGATVIRLLPGNILKELGQISHYPKNWSAEVQPNNYGYYNTGYSNYSDYSVTRSIVIGEEIVTISNSTIKLSDVQTLAEIKDITLKNVTIGPESNYWPMK